MTMSLPSGEEARRLYASLFCRRVREVERLSAMEDKPEISSSSAFSSWLSALPRIVPIALAMKPCGGVSLTFRCSARNRLFFAASMSFVASSPACLRATSDSVTGLCLAPNVCQGAETAANPESSAISEIPIMPTRSRHASLRSLPGCDAISWMYVPGMPFPSHQNPNNHIVNPVPCNIQAVLGIAPLSVRLNDHPALDTTD